MSKKGNDTPTSVRIRDNQRRSRNRRKELLEDLQARVQEYERKGIAATQQMQHAARYVALENTRLRTLLAHHGIKQAEVDAYLKSCDENEATQGVSPNAPNVARCEHPAPASTTPNYVSHPAPTTNGPRRAVNAPDVSSNLPLHISKREPSAPVANTPDNKRSRCCQTSGNRTGKQVPEFQQKAAENASEAPECPSTADCFCPPTVTPSNQSIDNGLEISCEAAASIIIEMRGEGDVDSIRASLGCAGQESCTVRNSTVLQIMDEG